MAAFVVARPRAVLALALGAALAAGLALPALEVDPSPRALVEPSAASLDARALLREHVGDTDHVLVVLVEAADVLEPEVLAYVRRVSRHLAADPEVAEVQSVTEVPLPRPRTFDDPPPPLPPPTAVRALEALVASAPDRFEGGALAASARVDGVVLAPLGGDVDALRDAVARVPLLDGRLVDRPGPDGRRTLTAVAARLAVGDDEALARTTARLAAEVQAMTRPPATEIRLTGLPMFWLAMSEGLARDQQRLLPAAVAVSGLVLLLAFRWWPAVVLATATVGLTVLVLLGGLAALGLPLDVLTNVVPAVLIVLGVSDAVHLLHRYRAEWARHRDQARAVNRTVRAMALACLFTSLTTAVGFASLAVSETAALRRFGLVAAGGVLVAYLVTVTFLPAVLLMLPPPPVPRGTPRLEAGLAAITRRVLARPWLAVLAAALVAAPAVLGARRVVVDTRMADQLPPSAPVLEGLRRMERSLDGVRPLEVLVRRVDGAPLDPGEVLARLDAVATWARGQAGVLRASTADDLLREELAWLSGDPTAREAALTRDQRAALLTLAASAGDGPSPLSAYLSPDRRLARLEIRLADTGAAASVAFLEALEGVLERELDERAYAVGWTGDAVDGTRAIASVERDLVSSLALAAAMIGLFLVALFRSLRLALLALPANALPLVLTAAWMAWRGIPLDVATAAIFSVGLGLAVDDTIHVIARFREERRRTPDIGAAVIASQREAGWAVTVTSLVFALGFSVLLASAFVPVRLFGELVAVTVVGCFLALVGLQPALLALGARRR